MNGSRFRSWIAGVPTKRMDAIRLGLSFIFLGGIPPSVFGTEPGSPEEPVRVVGTPKVDFSKPDGGLRPVVGVQSYQVLRSCRNFPQLSDSVGWTYHHHPMITYWNGMFYVLFNGSPVGEECGKAHVQLSVSRNGKDWSFPRVIFPSVLYQGGYTFSNHRMGFFISPDGRLLASTAYFPQWERRIQQPNEDTERTYFGVVVREVRKDGSFGPIHFIAHNRGDFQESELPFPLYTASKDAGFIAGCEVLRADRLITLHWWEQIKPENFDFPQTLEDFIRARGDRKFLKGISYFRRKDGAVVALCKFSWSALSFDNGTTWNRPVQLTTISEGYPKIWAQRTEDGRYALGWVPSGEGKLGRYPMVWATGDDGIVFSGALVVNGEVYRHYEGITKDAGPCNYQRGIYDGSRADAPGTDMWITYSMSKEDIWVSRVPVPIRGTVEENVNDSFDRLDPEGPVTGWNVYHPAWAPVSIAAFPSKTEKSLKLTDGDPHDYAKAFRVFPESQKASIAFSVLAGQNTHGRLEIEAVDSSGARPVRLQLTAAGKILAESWNGVHPLVPYAADRWYAFQLDIDCTANRFSVSVDGRAVARDLIFDARNKVHSVERLVFRTGPYRGVSLAPVDPDLDRRLDAPAVFHVDNVRIVKIQWASVHSKTACIYRPGMAT